MSQNRLCKTCGKSFLVGENSKKKKKPTCSEACRRTAEQKQRFCKNGCKPETLFVREVFYKNGTNHLQQACEKCLKVKYLPKQWGVAAGVIEK